MPLSMSMKIQPIDSRDESTTEPPLAPAPRPPVVKSRLRRLFRIGGGEEPAVVAPLPASDHCFDPSSVCLAKMVQNFIEENNSDKQSAKCSRNRCNCFNGGSDSSDTEADGIDAADFLKSLVACSTVNEKNVLADTAKIVEKNSRVCKRKDDLRKAVVDALIGLGYDASVCKSKWEKSPSLPAGEYEYVDVILVGGERLIIDVDFRSEFEIARSTKSYKLILQTLPNVFVGKPERLKKIIVVASEAVRQSLKKKGMHFPPWRKTEYFEAKWLSPHTRLLPLPVPPPPVAASPATSPLLVGPVAESVVDVENNLTKSAPDGNGEEEEEEEEEEESCSSSPPGNAAQLGDANNPQFAMSECSSGEEEEDEDDGEKEKLEI